MTDKIKEELKKKIEVLRGTIKKIDAVILRKVEDDVLNFEMESEFGKRKVDSISLAELRKTKEMYEKELVAVESELNKTSGLQGIRTIIPDFVD